MTFETFAEACRWLVATGYEFKPLYYAAPESRQRHDAGFWAHPTKRQSVFLGARPKGGWLVWS